MSERRHDLALQCWSLGNALQGLGRNLSELGDVTHWPDQDGERARRLDALAARVALVAAQLTALTTEDPADG